MTRDVIDRESHHIEPEHFYASAPVVDMHQRPDMGRDRQLRYGEHFGATTRRSDGFFFGSSDDAKHLGWALESELSAAAARGAPTHRVSARQTHVYSEPDFKSPETIALPHLSRLCVTEQEGRFSKTELGWVPSAHLSEGLERDPVTVAELYLGVPYLWGGNSIWGLDCSGLVHVGLMACGKPCPSDSGPQERLLGKPVQGAGAYQRGDLLFWKGHVAWVSDAETLLHANAHHMAVAYEPIEAAIRRIEEQGDGPVTAHKRLETTA